MPNQTTPALVAKRRQRALLILLDEYLAEQVALIDPRCTGNLLRTLLATLDADKKTRKNLLELRIASQITGHSPMTILTSLFKRRGWSALILLAALGNMMLPSPGYADTPKPRITIASVGRLQLTGSGATVDMMLDVRNPTSVDLTLTALTFRCDFDQAAQAHGKSTATVMVPSNDHALVPVRLTVGNDGLNGLVNLLASGARSVNYKLDGVATIGPMMLDVPFTQSGKIGLPH